MASSLLVRHLVRRRCLPAKQAAEPPVQKIIAKESPTDEPVTSKDPVQITASAEEPVQNKRVLVEPSSDPPEPDPSQLGEPDEPDEPMPVSEGASSSRFKMSEPSEVEAATGKQQEWAIFLTGLKSPQLRKQMKTGYSVVNLESCLDNPCLF